MYTESRKLPTQAPSIFHNTTGDGVDDSWCTPSVYTIYIIIYYNSTTYIPCIMGAVRCVSNGECAEYYNRYYYILYGCIIIQFRQT